MKKTLKLLIAVMVFAVMVSAGAVMAFADNADGVHEPNATYDGVMAGIKTLEGYASDYRAESGDTTPVNRLVMNFIRTGTYDSTLWNIIAGKKNTGFIEYVHNQDEAAQVEALRSQLFIALPDGAVTDFAHMFASMESYANGFRNFGGWYGDLAQLMIDVSKQDGTAGSVSNSYIAAYALINIENSRFNCYDVVADLDAYNIMKKLSYRGVGNISDAFEAYFSDQQTMQNRCTLFVANCLNLGKNARMIKISTRMGLVTVSDSILVTLLGATEKQYVSAATRIGVRAAFARFIYEQINLINEADPAIGGEAKIMLKQAEQEAEAVA